MNIKIKDYVGFSAENTVKLLNSLLEKRKPEEGSFDYGMEYRSTSLIKGNQVRVP